MLKKETSLFIPVSIGRGVMKIAFISLLSFVMLSSCKKENPIDDDAVVVLEDFYGSYYVESTCGANYTMSIREQNPVQDDTVMIDGLLNFFDYTYAAIDGKNISFSDGEFKTCNGNPTTYSATGSGSFADDVITMTYTWSFCGDSGECTLTATKQ